MAKALVRIVYVPEHWNSNAQCHVEAYFRPVFVKVPKSASYLYKMPRQICESEAQAKSVALEILAGYGIKSAEFEVLEGG